MDNIQFAQTLPANVPSWHGFVPSTWEAAVLIELLLQGLIQPAGKHEHNLPVASGDVFVSLVGHNNGHTRFTTRETWSQTRSAMGSKQLLALEMREPKGQRAQINRPNPPRVWYSDLDALKAAIFSPNGLDLAAVDRTSSGWDWLRTVAGDHTIEAKDSVPGGLIKKTISVKMEAWKFTVTSFYTLRDAWRCDRPDGLAAPSSAFPGVVLRQQLTSVLDAGETTIYGIRMGRELAIARVMAATVLAAPAAPGRSPPFLHPPPLPSTQPPSWPFPPSPSFPFSSTAP